MTKDQELTTKILNCRRPFWAITTKVLAQHERNVEADLADDTLGELLDLAMDMGVHSDAQLNEVAFFWQNDHEVHVMTTPCEMCGTRPAAEGDDLCERCGA